MTGPGRKKRKGPTKHAWRLHWLFTELLAERTPDGLPRFATQVQLAEYLQIGKQYVNQVLNIQTSGVGGIGADIIEHLMHRVGILPDWFFGEFRTRDDQQPETSYRDYLATARELQREVRTVKRSQVAANAELSEMRERMERLEEMLAALLEPKSAKRR